MIYMRFADTDKHNRYYNKKHKEYPQREKQVSLVCVNVFCELLKQDVLIYWLFYLL
jgi:hypothetical protein